MMTKVRPVILAGGSGTRLWPLSRSAHPKQFIPLAGKRSLFQEACLRFSDEQLFGRPTVITHEEYRFLVLEQLRELGLTDIDIIIEPASRNTAPAAAVAAFFIHKRFGASPLLITPADHLTENNEDLLDAIRAGLPHVLEGRIGVFGIRPTYAHPGYGYLIKGSKLADRVHVSRMFVEKPNTERAEQLIQQDGALWNSGVYLTTTSTLIQELEMYEHDVHEGAQTIANELEKAFEYFTIKKEAYSQMKNISIDKAVGERSNNVIIIETAVSWSDLGSWSSLHKQLEKNDHGTILRGDALAINTKDSYIESTSRLVAAYGLSDIGIIETKDAVAVFPLSQSDNIRLLVQELDRVSRKELITHTLVKRPWGEYEILDTAHNYQIKRLTVYPGGSSSLQRHTKRAEHWLVISGTASVVRDQEHFELRANDTIYIPTGSLHKIENKTVLPVTIIETQTGTYFGEDDIERLDDKYGRS